MAKQNLLDKLVLFRHSVYKATSVSKSLTVFYTKSKSAPVILKFSYLGNVQYHKLSQTEVLGLELELRNELRTAQTFE